MARAEISERRRAVHVTLDDELETGGSGFTLIKPRKDSSCLKRIASPQSKA
jgi:hypothetical protein